MSKRQPMFKLIIQLKFIYFNRHNNFVKFKYLYDTNGFISNRFT